RKLRSKNRAGRYQQGLFSEAIPRHDRAERTRPVSRQARTDAAVGGPQYDGSLAQGLVDHENRRPHFRYTPKKPHGLKGRVIALDIETTGLDAFHGDRAFCWGHFSSKGEYGYMRVTPENLAWLQSLFDDPSLTLVFHNAKFDLEMLYWSHGIDIFNSKAKVECTLILHKVLFSTALSHSLEYIGPKYTGRSEVDKVEITQWLKERNTKRLIRERGGKKLGFDDAPDDLVRRRVLWDVETTILLYGFLRPKVSNVCPDLYETERQLMYVCVDMECRGVVVDLTKARELKEKALGELKRIKRMLNEMVLPLAYVKDRKDRKTGEKVPTEIVIEDDFNPNSPDQLPAAFRKLGIELKYKSKPKKKKNKKTGRVEMMGGGNWSFDEYSMVRYVSKQLAAVIRESGEDGWPAHKFIDEVIRIVKAEKLKERELLPPLVLQYRQLSKMVSTYYDTFLEKAVDRWTAPSGREYGVLHCRFNQSAADTGRFSSSDPNLQNQPRLLGPRECFVPRRGRWNWHLDYSQVEMRFFCHFAEDKGMAKAIDDDVHLYVATKIYKKPK